MMLNNEEDQAGDKPEDAQAQPHGEILPHSAFTKGQKLWISFLASFAGMFSTMCSYIYYPALVPIAEELGVSITLVNLTVTSYLLIAAVAPAFMGDMADQSGRRPVYIVMFSLFVGANLGIALQRSYAALLVLRMLQSAGSSGLIAVAYGVIADITTSNERGGYCGMLDLLIQFALCVGPIIGGSITQELGWRWIFWFLVILTGTQFLVMLLFFPETQRSIVQDGSVRPSGIHWSLFVLVQKPKASTKPGPVDKPTRHWPNPLACLKIFQSPESLAVISLYSITYAVKMSLQASLGTQCVEIYNLDYLQAGLVYLPAGIGGAAAAFVTGKYLDKNYRTIANKRKNGVCDSQDFPLEHARLKGIYVLIISSALETVGYGIALMTGAHISVMIIMQFLIGLTTAGIFTMTATLLTDVNESKSATAQGACSLTRCLLAAGAIAVLQPLVDGAGLGWCFAVYAILLLLEIPVVWLLHRRGPQWRKARAIGMTSST